MTMIQLIICKPKDSGIQFYLQFWPRSYQMFLHALLGFSTTHNNTDTIFFSYFKTLTSCWICCIYHLFIVFVSVGILTY